MTTKNGAKVFIKNENLGKYLFVLRDNKTTTQSPNMYGLLGGKIEEGEQPIDALKRELHEESNVRVSNIEELGSKTFSYLNKDNSEQTTPSILFLFLGRTDQTLEELELYEGTKLEYFTIDEVLAKSNLAPAIQESINEYRNSLM